VSKLDRLRAYLEQRRELGESELTLDALEVDDVLRVVGALRTDTAAAPAAGTSAPPAAPRVPAAPTPRRSEGPAHETSDARERDVPGSATGDWRAVLGDAATSVTPPPPPTPVRGPAASPAEPVRATPPRGSTLTIGIVVPLGLTVERGVSLAADLSGAWQSLEDVAAAIGACKACSLASSATQPVPGVGNPQADVMVVGEAPGEKEDLSGEPFVGPAGELLNKILGAIQLQRGDVYICNVLKHRPPGNRNPLPEEVRACAPFLQRQIDLVQPKMILAFGTFAAQSLLNTTLALGKLRQQVHRYQGIPLIATYHPAALLRNDAWKRPTWEDVKLARRVLDATVRS
jgi:uracil-DNA glycosylase